MKNSSSSPLVLVIGGGGYIGSWLIRKLLDDNYAVRVFDNFLFGRDGVSDLKNDALEIVEGDICDTRSVSSAMLDAEIVVLLACMIGRRVEPMKWSNTRNVNLLASSVVLDAAIEHGVSRFIFASTDSVYGTQTGVMYETATPDPVSLYSRLKLRMEERTIRAKSATFHPTALRITTCYGYSPRMRFDLVGNGLIRDAICKKEIVIEGPGQIRSLIHVRDAAKALHSCVKAHENLISGEVFNIADINQTYKLQQLANMAQAIVPDIKYRSLEHEPDLADYRVSSSKIEKMLDFKPEWNIEQSMAEIAEMISTDKFGDCYSLKYSSS